MSTLFSLRTFAALSLAGLLTACAMMGSASTVNLRAALSGAQEVPPVSSSASGTAEGTFNKDTNKLTYKVTYSGLSGPATAGHFHGPAASGQNAGVALGFANAASPIQGEATLTPAQAADLLAGRWYVNIHTRANPGGEIRGQVAAN